MCTLECLDEHTHTHANAETVNRHYDEEYELIRAPLHVHVCVHTYIYIQEKLRAELKHEVDKISSSNRLDINLEKGRMREEISVMV